MNAIPHLPIPRIRPRNDPISGRAGGFAKIRRALSRHFGEQKPMIAPNNDTDLRQVFSRFLLVANIFMPHEMEDEKRHLARILEECGLTVMRSNCMILDKNRFGDSLITIARYSVEYRDPEEAGGRTVYIEGDLAMQTDYRGNVSISISGKPGLPESGSLHPDGSLLGDEGDRAPSLS